MVRDFPRADAPGGVCRRSSSRRNNDVVAQLPGDSRQPHRPNRGHRLAARARDPARHRAAARVRSCGSRRGRVWDTSLETIMFGRMIQTMKDFFSIVGLVTLALAASA